MVWLSEYWALVSDHAVAFGAITGTVLGVFNAVKLHRQEKLTFEVFLTTSEWDGNPIIKVVNHSRFPASISEVGLISDDGEYHQLMYINDFSGPLVLPKRIESKAEMPFELDISWPHIKAKSMYRPFVDASTGERFVGRNQYRGRFNSFYSIAITTIKSTIKSKFRRNPFLDI